jgi:hypothetical protein
VRINHSNLRFQISFANDEQDNAYVSGLQEDLNFHSNQLVDLNSMYIAGAVIGQLPFTFLFPMFPMNYTIPGLEIGWGIFTLLQYRAQSFSELMAYRFFVGIFEVSKLVAPRTNNTFNITRLHFFQVYITCLERGTEETSSGGEAEYSTLVKCLEHSQLV